MKVCGVVRSCLVFLSALFLFFIGISSVSSAQQGKILVILSGADSISLKGGGTHKTGYFLSEMAIPSKLLKNAGYEAEYANPTGAEPVMDKTSDSRQFFASEEDYLDAKRLAKDRKLLRPRKLSSYSNDELRRFDGIFIPGGHAPMADLYKDPDLGRMLRFFHQNKKPTASICHGPVSLLAAREGKSWIYEGYSMTALSDAEEKEAEKSGFLGGNVLFYICTALADAGARISHADRMWQSHVVRDRELITGQNPASCEEFSKVFLEALTAEKPHSV
ncbi:MAG: type 1 glutamine amidotransferase domain-containing protein [Candidatus Xenobiia bacterium LiM19]